MPRQARANPLALAVLVSLYERPMHPYEVAQLLRKRAKHESVRLNFGSLYAVVESLERRGLIRAKETVRQGRRPERTVYEITNDGSREMIDWTTELLAVPSKEYPSFLAGLTFVAALAPEDALAALRMRVDALALRLTAIRSALRVCQEAGLPRLFALESEFEEHLTAAELQFVEALVEDIESGNLDGLAMWGRFHLGEAIPQLDMTFDIHPDPSQ